MFAFVLVAGCADDAPPAPEEEVPAAAVAEPFEIQFNQGGVVVGGGPATIPTRTECNVVDQEGLDVVHHVWEAPAAINGTALRVLSLTATLTLNDPSLLDADMSIDGPNGQRLGATTDFNVQTGPQETFSTDAGLTPGSYTFGVHGCTGRGAYHLSVTFVMQAETMQSVTTVSMAPA